MNILVTDITVWLAHRCPAPAEFHYANSLLTLVFSRSFSVLYAQLSMRGGRGRTSCDGVRSPVHRAWNGRDVNLAGICDRV